MDVIPGNGAITYRKIPSGQTSAWIHPSGESPGNIQDWRKFCRKSKIDPDYFYYIYMRSRLACASMVGDASSCSSLHILLIPSGTRTIPRVTSIVAPIISQLSTIFSHIDLVTVVALLRSQCDLDLSPVRVDDVQNLRNPSHC